MTATGKERKKFIVKLRLGPYCRSMEKDIAEFVVRAAMADMERRCTELGLWVTGKHREKLCVEQIGGCVVTLPHLLTRIENYMADQPDEDKAAVANILRDLMFFWPKSIWKGSQLSELRKAMVSAMKAPYASTGTIVMASILQIVDSVHGVLVEIKRGNRHGLAAAELFRKFCQPVLGAWIKEQGGEPWRWDLTDNSLFEENCRSLHGQKIDVSTARVNEFVGRRLR